MSKKPESYKADRSGLADVDANLFRAAHACACRDEVRYYINGVHIERHPDGGVILVATDGHRLLAVRDRTGWCKKPVTIQLDRNGLEACKPPKRMPSFEPRVLVGRDGIARVGGIYVSPAKTTVAGPYPEWRKVVPVRKWKCGSASFNGSYIVEFGKVAEILGSPHRCIRILVDDESAPALVLFPLCADAFGVLMPMRAQVGLGLPIWMKPVMKGVKAHGR